MEQQSNGCLTTKQLNDPSGLFKGYEWYSHSKSCSRENKASLLQKHVSLTWGERSPSLQLQIRITPQSILIPLGCAPTKHKPGSASCAWGAHLRTHSCSFSSWELPTPGLFWVCIWGGTRSMPSSTYNPFLLFYHHKEPCIVCPLEHGTNAHFTFPHHTFWVSTNPCRGSRTLIHAAHLTKSCQVMPDIRPHDLSHQCLLTWYIHLRLVHCLLLLIPSPLSYCPNMTAQRHTKAATQWNRFTTTEGSLPHLLWPATTTTRCDASARLNPPSLLPTHTQAPTHSLVWSRSPGARA